MTWSQTLIQLKVMLWRETENSFSLENNNYHFRLYIDRSVTNIEEEEFEGSFPCFIFIIHITLADFSLLDSSA